MSKIQVPSTMGSFLFRTLQFYEEMLHDIKLCKRKGLDKQAEIQCCFEIATNYISRLVTDLSKYEFERIQDEIFFFKKLKPLFTAEAEFYTYQYHAELFKNTVEDGCPMELELFYRRQLQRMTKFSRDNPGFCTYLQEDSTANDVSYFSRDPKERTRSSHDKLVATYLAIQRYEEFVEMELKSIGIDMSLNRDNN